MRGIRRTLWLSLDELRLACRALHRSPWCCNACAEKRRQLPGNACRSIAVFSHGSLEAAADTYAKPNALCPDTGAATLLAGVPMALTTPDRATPLSLPPCLLPCSALLLSWPLRSDAATPPPGRRHERARS